MQRRRNLTFDAASTGRGKENKPDTYFDFFENAPVAFHLIGPTGVVLHANQACLNLLESDATNFIGQDLARFFTDSEMLAVILGQLAGGASIKARAAKIVCSSGQEKSVLIEANAYFEDGYFKYGRMYWQDITGHVLTDGPTQLKHDVLKVLAESSTTVEAMTRLVPILAQALGADVGLVWHANEKANQLQRLVLWRADPLSEADHILSKSNNISVNLSSGFPAAFWFSDRAQSIAPDDNTMCFGSAMAETMPEYKQIISFPIAIGRLNWGLFGFFARVQRPVSATLLALLEALGNQIGEFVDRQRAFENFQKMQESYSLAIAGANEGIWDWDFTSNDVYFSPRWKSLLGFEDHELENHFDTFRAYTHPDDYPRVMDAVQRHMETGKEYAEEIRMRTKGGDYIWISTRGHCSYNGLGQPVRMSGSHRDITDIKAAELARQRSEARLQDSESKFRQLAENIREVFWILSADRQQFVYISPAFEEFWGASCQDLYQDASIFFDAMVEEDRLKVSQKLDSGSIHQSGLELEFRIYRSFPARGGASSGRSEKGERDISMSSPEAEPKLRWMWAKIFPIKDDDGNLARLCGIAHDITDKKEVEKHVNEFYSTISHELRTPLTSIRAALGLVEDGLSGETVAEALEYTSIARDNCDRLIRLINDMLDIKKIEANHLELKLRRLSAIDVIQTTMDSLKPYAEQSGVTLQDVSVCPLGDFVGDSDRVIQILTNLLSNAIKYTPPSKSVLVSAAQAGEGHIRFSVKDEGPGIAESEKQDLFGPFQQLSCIENEVNRGTGLGLAISKVLVEKLNGTIGVNSRLGAGAEFWFELPAFSGESNPDQGQPAAAQEATSARASGLTQPLILILEDSDSIALILKSLLFRKGFAAVRSATIADATDLLERVSPDLVIADVHLPDGNGITFVNWLHSQSRAKHAHLPVVVLSGVEAAPGSLEHPALVDWVCKPFDGDKLLALIKQRLDKVADANGSTAAVLDN